MQIVTGQVRPQSGVPLLPTPEPAREAEFASLLGGLFAALQATRPVDAARDTAPPEPARGGGVRADEPSALDVSTPSRPVEAEPREADEPKVTEETPGRSPAEAEAKPAPVKDPAAQPGRAPGEDLAPRMAARPTAPEPVIVQDKSKVAPVPQAPPDVVSGRSHVNVEAPMTTLPDAPEGTSSVHAPASPVGFRLLAPPVVETAVEAPKPAPVVDTPASQPTPSGATLSLVAVPPPPAVSPVAAEPVPVASESVAPVSAAGSSALQGVSRLERLAKPLSPGMVERVATVVKLQASQNGGRVRMLLHPPHLGALKVDVVVREGTVFAKLETETGAARHALQSHLGDLRHALEEHGLSLGQMSVSVGQENLSGSHEGSTASPPPEPFPLEDDVVLDSRPEARRTSLLDLSA